MTNVSEIFLPIKGYEGIYEISNHGRVRSLDRVVLRPSKIKGKILRPSKRIYSGVTLSNEEGMIYPLVHRLVADAFISNPENKPFVNHKDGNKHNNSISNLEWVTPSENQLHAHAAGLNRAKKGEDNWNCRLSNEQVMEIYLSGETQKKLSKKFNVSPGAISLIKKGINWKHITNVLK